MIFVTGSQMRALEGDAIRMGADPLLLMERAAEGIVHCLFQMDASPRALMIAGTGNNGADALAAARILTREGGKAAVLLTGNMKTAQGKANLAFLRYLNIPALEAFPEDPSAFSVLVDGLFGTGFHGEPSPEAAA
ncbi:MAG: NAD(P)H-hydrate epimerase, partial [Clostridia bacterium]|nr:NAD(P)H-hydrate epimerase [Clostridia bacterium]